MRVAPAIALTLWLAGCALPGAHLVAGPVPELRGCLEAPRHTAAELAEVVRGSTISVIDCATGNTMATTMTTAAGGFVFVFDSGFTPGSSVYYLEAVKGLAGGGSPNRAGYAAARLRTLIQLQGATWRSLSVKNVVIGRSTTALACLASLRSFSSAQNEALLGTLSTNVPSTVDGVSLLDTFQGTGDLSPTDFARTWTLVDQALTADLDPVGAIFARPPGLPTSAVATSDQGMAIGPGVGMKLDGWTATGLFPGAGAAGTSVIMQGMGLGAGVGIALHGVSCPVTSRASDGTSLTFVVPSGLQPGSYPLVVRYGPWTQSALSFTVQ